MGKFEFGLRIRSLGRIFRLIFERRRSNSVHGSLISWPEWVEWLFTANSLAGNKLFYSQLCACYLTTGMICNSEHLALKYQFNVTYTGISCLTSCRSLAVETWPYRGVAPTCVCISKHALVNDLYSKYCTCSRS